ncbi:hypothetical protein [Hanstruepera ponticola]|uniref:hypothetical protein n=1 Tax=Hanstruepera ponticola TaxID=2042995 RepID=UPI000CF0352B|nr:hypothetical protein [Hanstruepera ponticola]
MKCFSILIVFISLFSYSQKREYSFDYLLEYEFTFHKENVARAKYYLTNSKDNSYLAIIKESDSLHFDLIFKHHDKAYANVKLLKSDFYKAEFINIDCESVVTNIKKYKIKDIVIETHKDTLINNEAYFIFKMELKNKPTNPKKRIGLVTKYFITNKNSVFHLPVYEDFHDFNRWTQHKKMPNGIYNQLLLVDLFDQPHASEILQSFHKIDKKIIISNGCNH